MKLSLSQSARMEQRLAQSPQMIQAMKILQLSNMELAECIEKELLENPFLERLETEIGQEKENPENLEGNSSTDTNSDSKNTLDTLERWERNSYELTSPKKIRGVQREASDRAYDLLQNTPAHEDSLKESLLSSLHLLELSEAEQKIGEYIIYSLDERGYLTEPVESIAANTGADMLTVSHLIEIVQQLGPAGIAAKDLRECLLIQIDRLSQNHHLARLIVDKHLKEIEANRIPKIAKATGHSITEVKEALLFIRTLNPKPGGAQAGLPTIVIRPDIVVEEVDGKYEVRLERGTAPELRISETYKKLLREAKDDPKVYDFLKKRIESAKWFIDAMEQRRSNIEKISNAIVQKQKDFLDHGIKALHPLKMQDIADEIGVHISTVSRAIAGRYIQTPRGIFSLKFFFISGTRAETGEVESQTSIKEMIAEIIAAENRRHPLSDEEIAKSLRQQSGLPIARRTITKYRKSLDIAPSNLRREF